MSYQLKDLTSDYRLERLFLSEKQPCALQFWVLQFKTDEGIENRVLYGRVLPYSFSNNSWSYSERDDSQSFGSFRASVTKLNLYIDSSLCYDFLRMVCEGRTINNISDALGLNVPNKLRERFGSVAIANEYSNFRPVSYLLNRDGDVRDSLASPHEKAGALSASIINNDKKSLLYYGNYYNKDLASMVISQLNSDTGMDFGGKDVVRFGDIELLVFPALDSNEMNLMIVTTNRINGGINVHFDSSQIPAAHSFHFVLTIENDNQIVYSKMALAKLQGNGIFEYEFKLDDKLFEIVDSVKVDVFSFLDDSSESGELCCSWKVYYIREVNFRTHVVGNNSHAVKFDWLEKNTSPQMVDRVSHALSFSARNPFSQSKIGGRIIDKWVPENRALKSFFAKLYPRESDGRFFRQSGPSHGEGTLQFVEWFKELVNKHGQKHITIFDPYFENVGLSLLTLNAIPGSEYTIFRSMPKAIDNEKPQRRKNDGLANDGVNNLIANCNHNRKLLQSSKVKIYGLKEKRLHDRYILILDDVGLPIEGFHLSNSFQNATENHPLLVTPIPTDVLYQTNQYVFELIQEANTSLGDNSGIVLLFDSKVPSDNVKTYESLEVLNDKLAGDVLSVWLKEPSLKGLYGKDLKAKMATLGVLQNESLHALPQDGLLNCINEMDGEFYDFVNVWNVIGDILAHTTVGDLIIDDLQSEEKFLSFLLRFLSISFQKVVNLDEKEFSVIDPSYFNMSLDDFIHSSLQTSHFHQSIKPNILSWAEFYALKYLWQYSPSPLLDLIEVEVKKIDKNYRVDDVIILSFMEKIIGEISLCLEFDAISDEQEVRLLKSDIPMFNWFGWNCIERRIIAELESNPEAKLDTLLPSFSYTHQVQFIGWAANRNVNNNRDKNFYNFILMHLHNNVLPNKLSNEDFKLLIDALRGHMRQLGWAEPWLFKDVVEPLLNQKRVDYEVVCDIWFQDLTGLLNKDESYSSILFSSEREGATTNICAYLLANSNRNYQNVCINALSKILGKQKAVIQQPLASTSDWSKWDDALTISLWILLFTKLSKYYLNELGILNHDSLEELLSSSSGLIIMRNKFDWTHHNELFAYLEKVEELI